MTLLFHLHLRLVSVLPLNIRHPVLSLCVLCRTFPCSFYFSYAVAIARCGSGAGIKLSFQAHVNRIQYTFILFPWYQARGVI